MSSGLRDVVPSIKAALRRILPVSVLETRRYLKRFYHRHHRFDHRYGVDTIAASVDPEPDVADALRPHVSNYEATPPETFDRIVRELQLDPARWHLVDLGSGKGAVVLFALQWGFARVTGVELSPRLHEIASQNLDRFFARPDAGAGEAGRVQLICDDATRYRFPDEPVVCYLSNPFKGPVLDAVVRNVAAWVASPRQEALIVYYHPISRHDAWDRTDFLDVVRRERLYTAYRPRRRV